MMPRITVVVPCYREEHRLRREGFRALHDAQISTLFVDDGSDDRTWAVIEAMVREEPLADGLRLSCNVGKGEAVRQGLLHALRHSPDAVGYLDADLAASAVEMLRVIAALDDPTVDVALGSRIRLLGSEVRRSPARHYLGRLFATAASVVLRLPVYDTQCGAKAFRVSPRLHAALARPFDSRWVFDVELLMRLLEPNDHRAVEVPLRSWADVGGGQLTPGLMSRAGWDLLRLGVDARRRA